MRESQRFKLEAFSSTGKDGEAHYAASRKHSEGRGQQEGNHCDRGMYCRRRWRSHYGLEQTDEQDTPGISLHAISGDQCTQGDEGIWLN